MLSSLPFSARLRQGLAWLEEQLNLRHTTAGCLFVSLVALPFVLVLWGMDAYALTHPEAGRFYRPDMLRWVFLQDTLGLLFYSAVLLYCWPRYRSSHPQLWLAYGLNTVILAGSTSLAILYGYKDTPMALVLLSSFVLTRAWFPLRVLLPGLVISMAMLVTAEVLTRRGVMPYAPLLAQPVITGEPLAWWWDIWVRVLYDMAVFFFSGAMFFIFAIMERRHRELEKLTRLDTLTGLLNRATFMRLLEIECAKQARHRRPACLMMCDIDHFKRINDTYGHPAGDAVLMRFGRLLQDAVRQPLDVPARFGGEEFVVLLPETDVAAARCVAERIIEQLRSQVFESEGRHFAVTVSIGIAETSDADGERALRLADANLYAAKAGGRDCVVASVAV